MPDVFLSYSRDDQATARRFAEVLQREGFNVWWDQSLDAGAAYDEVTEKALEEARAVVVLWSKSSVASRWVRAEATIADRLGTLVPIMIEPCKRPIMFELRQSADLSGWNADPADARWRSFIDGLRRFVTKDGAATPATSAPHAGSQPSATAPATLAAVHGKSRKAIAWAAVAAMVALAAGLAWYLHGATKNTPAGAVEASVAVLPFEDLSQGKDQEYFADGVTEEILNSLAAVQGLKVTGRTSSFAFKGKSADLRTIGETLNVAHLLEGSVRKAGNKLRITAQLINARSGYHVWSKIYERNLDDIFDVQADVAKSVAQALEVSLGVGEGARVPGQTRNVEAYDAVLAGTRLGAVATPQAMEAAIDQLKRAVALDPSYAQAWMALSDLYGAAQIIMPSASGKSWRQLSSDAFNEAKRLAPDAFYIIGGTISDEADKGNWSQVEKLYEGAEESAARQGVRLNIERDRGYFLFTMGHLQKSIAMLERARDRDPLDSNTTAILAEAYAAAGNLTAAFAEFDRGLKLENHVRLLGSALVTALATHDRRSIEPRLDAFVARGAAGSEVHAAMKPLLDKPALALAELRRLSTTAQSSQIRAAIGTWVAYFGDPQTALSLLRTPAMRGNANDLLRLWRPVVRDVRKLTAFRQMAAELGLVDYWRQYGWPDLCHPVGNDFECN